MVPRVVIIKADHSILILVPGMVDINLYKQATSAP